MTLIRKKNPVTAKTKSTLDVHRVETSRWYLVIMGFHPLGQAHNYIPLQTPVIYSYNVPFLSRTKLILFHQSFLYWLHPLLRSPIRSIPTLTSMLLLKHISLTIKPTILIYFHLFFHSLTNMLIPNFIINSFHNIPPILSIRTGCTLDLYFLFHNIVSLYALLTLVTFLDTKLLVYSRPSPFAFT